MLAGFFNLIKRPLPFATGIPAKKRLAAPATGSISNRVGLPGGGAAEVAEVAAILLSTSALPLMQVSGKPARYETPLPTTGQQLCTGCAPCPGVL